MIMQEDNGKKREVETFSEKTLNLKLDMELALQLQEQEVRSSKRAEQQNSVSYES
jgi:hypothetical protein